MITAQLDEEIPTVFAITAFMNEVITIVEDYYQIHLDDNSLTYFRFTTHLKYFGQRLFNGEKYYDSNDLELLELIKKRYQKAYDCTEKIREFVLEKYDHELTMDECLYLTIHIAKVSNEIKK